MIDTHTHPYMAEEGDLSGGAQAVRRAIDAGVERMIFPNVDVASIRPMLDLAARFPENVACAMGLHPTEVKENWQEELPKILVEIGDGSKYVALGEIGMDLYWDKTFRAEQMEVFDTLCTRAEEVRLPIIIHCREGLDETLEVLQGHKGLPAVFHSFGGTAEDVERIRSLGDYFFGINGIVTFKNSKLSEVLPVIGLDRILLETDAPYLAPTPFRGKRNESAYLPLIASKIGETHGLSRDEIDRATTANALALFPKLGRMEMKN